MQVLTAVTVVPIETPEPTTTITSQSTTTLSSTSYTTVTVVVSPSSSAPAEPSTPAETPVEPSTPAQTPAQTPVEPTTPTPPPVQLPTPSITSFSSTGTFTIPATTLTVTDTTTVCGATTTDLPSGSHTYGGVTTVVETATTVTCPVATVKPSGSTVTSVIETTTYVCPTPGTYTIAPTTTFVPTSTVIVYPTPTSFTPGTYTQPEQTLTVTQTDYTYVCPPFTNSNEPTQPVTPATTTPAAPNTPTTPTSTPTSLPKPPSGGTRMGMTYSPYANDGGCKGKAEIMKDVSLIKSKGFGTVRVYATDCNSLEYIGAAAKQSGLKMIIGVFIDGSGIEGAQEQVTAITKWAQWDMVTLIVVGNESIQSGSCDAGQLASFIESSKQKFKQAGYNGNVTTTEPINVWQQHGSALCSAVDLVGANIHPFFNDHTSADQAGKFVQSQVDILKNICPGKPDVMNLETGWPSKGNPNGDAVPSPQDQMKAVKAIEEAFGANSVFFSYSNDLWKTPGPWEVEQYWGCIDVF